MEKNNNKYFIFSICLFISSLYLNYNTIFSYNTYLYKHFDFTGITRTIQMILTIILFIISIICLIKSKQAGENGVDFLFNKCMIAVFLVYVILSICMFIYVRSTEEESALKMKNDITNYGEQLMQHNVTNKNSILYDFYNTTSDIKAKSEYAVNDEYYERKKEIIEQIENSSTFERYISMLFYNYSYEHYGKYISDETEYYGIFLKLILIGFVGAIFYLFNREPKDDTNIFYNKNNIYEQ